jgi:peptide/nickel transport system substrate-binding protein
MNARSLVALALLVAVAAATLAGAPVHAQAPKRGGILNAMLGEDPPGFSIHEVATISGLWPVMPCYSNLVLFDQLKAYETVETVLPELAEKWSWQDNYRNLVFFLRRGVKWHDGHPFTSRDVKYTFDVVREAADAPAKLRLNPRKEWYTNIDAIEAADPHTVVFRLKRPPAVAAADARLRLLAGLPCARAARRAPPALHRHRALQAQAIRAR